MHIDLHVKYPLFLSYFNETWIFSTDFRKTLKYQISWKSRQWETNCSMRKEGRTDRRADRHDEDLQTRVKIAYAFFTSNLTELALSVTVVLDYILLRR